MNKPTFCAFCGGGVVEMNLRGSAMSYRDVPDLTITADVTVPRCTVCGEEWLDEALSEALEQALATSYASFRGAQTGSLISALVEGIGLEQREIEMIAGLSAGYISKAKRSTKLLSPPTFRFLHALRMHPREVLSATVQLDPRLTAIAAKILRP